MHIAREQQDMPGVAPVQWHQHLGGLGHKFPEAKPSHGLPRERVIQLRGFTSMRVVQPNRPCSKIPAHATQGQQALLQLWLIHKVGFEARQNLAVSHVALWLDVQAASWHNRPVCCGSMACECLEVATVQLESAPYMFIKANN